MSSFWDITVTRLARDTIELQVVLTHPDIKWIPKSHRFAFQLLLDEAHVCEWNGSTSRALPTGPLGEAVDRSAAGDWDFLVQNARRFVRSVEKLDAAHEPFDEAATRLLIDREVEAAGLRRDTPEWEPRWIEAWRLFWKNPSRPPHATLRVAVTAPRWLEHLRPGQRWDSAAYGPTSMTWYPEQGED